MLLKAILQPILPKSLFDTLLLFRRSIPVRRAIKKAYRYDLQHYLNHSGLINQAAKTVLTGRIINAYHSIEKGLTMPDFRPGFGKGVLLGLINDCLYYLQTYGDQELQIKHALGVLKAYEAHHEQLNHPLDAAIQVNLNRLHPYQATLPTCNQLETTKVAYFSASEAPFNQFAISRASVRHYTTEPIPVAAIQSALTLATHTPSACNRQCWRTYQYEDLAHIQRILDAQGGNRGFGHLVTHLIVITAETGVFQTIDERNQAYIDGGMYAMNLLYALHHQQIACCILNCSHTPDKDRTMRTLTGIKPSEVFIAMITCGIPPSQFKLTLSKRYPYTFTNTRIPL
jgi:nitroreductase